MCEKGFLKSSYLSETTEQLGWNVPCVIHFATEQLGWNVPCVIHFATEQLGWNVPCVIPLQSLYSFC